MVFICIHGQHVRTPPIVQAVVWTQSRVENYTKAWMDTWRVTQRILNDFRNISLTSNIRNSIHAWFKVGFWMNSPHNISFIHIVQSHYLGKTCEYVEWCLMLKNTNYHYTLDYLSQRVDDMLCEQWYFCQKWVCHGSIIRHFIQGHPNMCNCHMIYILVRRYRLINAYGA